jgi:hypothetical protein
MRTGSSGYLPLLTLPEHVVHFFRDVLGQYPITRQVLARRTNEYRGWVVAYAQNHKIPVLKAQKVAHIFGARYRTARRQTAQWVGKLDHGHHIMRIYCKKLVGRTCEKFSTFLR